MLPAPLLAEKAGDVPPPLLTCRKQVHWSLAFRSGVLVGPPKRHQTLPPQKNIVHYSVYRLQHSVEFVWEKLGATSGPGSCFFLPAAQHIDLPFFWSSRKGSTVSIAITYPSPIAIRPALRNTLHSLAARGPALFLRERNIDTARSTNLPRDNVCSCRMLTPIQQLDQGGPEASKAP